MRSDSCSLLAARAAALLHLARSRQPGRTEALLWLSLVLSLAAFTLAVVHLATRRHCAITAGAGHTSERVLLGGRSVRIESLSERPSIRLLHSFASAEETAHIIAAYTHTLEPSTVAGPKSEYERVGSRSSSTAFLPAGTEDAVLRSLETRAVLLTGIPEENWETLQLTRYSQGQEYRPHHDFFGEDVENNRAATIFVYLSDMADGQGGETEFVRAKVSVRPRRGNALLWFNCAARGRTVMCDRETEHAGRAPAFGEKFGLNMFARTMPYR